MSPHLRSRGRRSLSSTVPPDRGVPANIEGAPTRRADYGQRRRCAEWALGHGHFEPMAFFPPRAGAGWNELGASRPAAPPVDQSPSVLAHTLRTAPSMDGLHLTRHGHQRSWKSVVMMRPPRPVQGANTESRSQERSRSPRSLVVGCEAASSALALSVHAGVQLASAAQDGVRLPWQLFADPQRHAFA